MGLREEPDDMPAQLSEIKVRNVTIKLHRAGHGPTVLFLHGAGGVPQWLPFFDALAERYELLVPEHPGFGASDDPPWITSMSDLAMFYLDLIEEAGLARIHLVGNSLGGAVCTRVAGRRPDLIRTLTLVSPALPDLRPRLIPLRVMVFCAPGVGRWAMRRLGRTTAESRTFGTVQEVYLDPGLMHPARYAEEADEVRRRDRLAYNHEVLIGSARGLVTEYFRPGPRSLWRDAARVTAPTLVLYGSHDRLVSPLMAARAARAFAAARVHVLPRMGHVAMMERPDLVAGEMRELLASVAARTGKAKETERERGTSQHAATQADAGGAG